ncbi:DoxX family protein [Paenibacillus gansuensis]|uniref:DoxX family protein n=1 Tax=Paenibacillus gansuensis TaxID=306542 RepID=A0ABW5P9P9_9BACL
MNSHQLGALILRVVLGITFLVHGIVKFQGGIGNIAGWFETIGLSGFMAYAVAGIEIAGGIALIIGLGTRVVSALFAIMMIGATLKVKLSVGFLGNGQLAGWELDLAFLAIAIYLVLNGSYALSLDKALGFSKRDDRAA